MTKVHSLKNSDSIFNDDMQIYYDDFQKRVERSRFLVIGGAGSIGRAVSKLLFSMSASCLHVVDINENNLAELVRDIRSSLGYTTENFKTFTVDCGSPEFQYLMANEGPYDFILNLSAYKHVRSEKDPYTLMSMLRTNIINPKRILENCNSNTQSYFCVSTDKASDPENLMGASKLIMEQTLLNVQTPIKVNFARFANIAYSDGSLLDSFRRRFELCQPFSCPIGVQRYFMSSYEAAQLCLLTALYAKNGEIYFPKRRESLRLSNFVDLARTFLDGKGYEAVYFKSEDEARKNTVSLIDKKKWPVYIFQSDTTGEKDIETFFNETDNVVNTKFSSIGAISAVTTISGDQIDRFLGGLHDKLARGTWHKSDLVSQFHDVLMDFNYTDLFRYLDDRM